MDFGCKGDSDERESFGYVLGKVNTFVVLSFVGVSALVAVSATVYIFVKRSEKERPLFVTCQMFLLNMFWISFSAYYISLLTHSKVENNEFI